jgi:SAM-dependent methyltransferase
MDIPFGDGSFDIVIANHVLHHVPTIPRAVEEIRRVLAPGGTLYASTNGLDHLQELFALAPNRTNSRSVMENFSLENGAGLLGAAFGRVELRTFADGLDIAEPQAVVDYLASSMAERGTTEEDLERARALVAAEIAAHHTFHVRKSVGMFISS